MIWLRLVCGLWLRRLVFVVWVDCGLIAVGCGSLYCFGFGVVGFLVALDLLCGCCLWLFAVVWCL